MVLALASLRRIPRYLRNLSMPKHPQVSILIPTIGRKECLSKCLQSINNQSFTDYELILEEEEGSLTKIRNQAAKKAKGEYLVFIDDDVITTEDWLKSIVGAFSFGDVFGVSGPSVIPDRNRKERDLFKWKKIKMLYDALFLGRRASLPGHFTKSGAWTTGACDESCRYQGEVEFLEACNMSYRRDVFEQVGGFDESYKGIGDWSEPDLSFRVRKLGGRLIFIQGAKLYHFPSRSGAYKKRKADSGNRLGNYMLFSKRWIKPCFSHSLYKLFMRSYYAYKTIE